LEGYGFEPWLKQNNFLFAKINFWHECERPETLVEKGAAKQGLEKPPLMV